VKKFTYNGSFNARTTSVNRSVQQLLDQTAKRGSWYGGGSVAALACALSAALLEKLVSPTAPRRATKLASFRRRSPAAGMIRATRTQALRLVDEDARTFAHVIKAMYQQDKIATRKALKQAIEVPLRVHVSAHQILQAAERAKRDIPKRYHSDLTCVIALAKASREAARAFVETNLAWLGDKTYTRQVRRKLARA